MGSVVCNIYDPVTHKLVFSKDDFTFLCLADFDTGTAAGSKAITVPPGVEVVIQQSTPTTKGDASVVTVSGNTVSWTAGERSTRVRVFIQ
jgi:hypothetical protein